MDGWGRGQAGTNIERAKTPRGGLPLSEGARNRDFLGGKQCQKAVALGVPRSSLAAGE